MKKFIKNTLLSFVIIFTILNLILYTTNIILHESIVRNIVTLYLDDNRDVEASIQLEKGAQEDIERMKNIYGEDSPATALVSFQSYTTGMNQVLHGQTTVLIATVVLSTVIGIIIHLKEESKMKEILYFVMIGIIFILICMGYSYVMGEFRDTNIIEAFGETIDIYGLWYIIGYMLVYIFRIYKDKKKVIELNKELENKNK